MALRVLDNVDIMHREDTKLGWATENPVLKSSEIGRETDTNLFKFGDGETTWNNLPYANDGKPIVFQGEPENTDWDFPLGAAGIDAVTGEYYYIKDNAFEAAVWEQLVTMSQLNAMLSNLGAGDMLKSEYATNGTAGKVDKAVTADKLSAAKTFALTGDVEGTVSSDLASGISVAATLATVLTGGATSGLYKITVDAKGRITAVTNVTAADLPNITLAKVTDAGTAAALDTGITAGNAVVVEQNGLINPALMPPLAIVDVEEFNTVAEMLAWANAESGDMAFVNLSTGTEIYINKGGDPSVLSSWKRLNIPTGAVVTVNGQTGVVTLTTSNIPEGSNLYYTETRATDNFNTNFALKSSAGLTDGADILRSTDTFVIKGGKANRT